MNTIENIVATVNNSKANLEIVENQLFRVIKSAIPTRKHKDPVTGKMIILSESTESFDVFTNTGISLGVMGKTFNPMQPKELYDNILATVHEYGANLDLSTLKFRTFDDCKKIEFSIKMHPIEFINQKGINDVTNLEVTFSTSYDGTKSSVISLYTERLVCTNGMVASKLQGALKGRNTLGGKTKILSYKEELTEIINGAENYKEKLIALNNVKLTRKQIEAFKLSLFGFNTESLKKSEKGEKQRLGMLETFEKALNIEFKRTGQTAFGLLQGVTYYTNHLANTGKNTSKVITDAEYIRFNQGFKTNEKAQEILFALLD